MPPDDRWRCILLVASAPRVLLRAKTRGPPDLILSFPISSSFHIIARIHAPTPARLAVDWIHGGELGPTPHQAPRPPPIPTSSAQTLASSPTETHATPTGGARLSPPWTPEQWGHAAADGLGGEGVAGRETGVCRYDVATGVGLSYLWRQRLLQLAAVFATTYKGVGICYLWRRLLPTLASTT
jgi:hypothetical protein